MTRTANARKSHQSDRPRTDVYTRVTDTILAQLQQEGVRPWMKPWQAGHKAGHISKPLRCNGQKYKGIPRLLFYG
jgi:antirestriction protein ArdC